MIVVVGVVVGGNVSVHVGRCVGVCLSVGELDVWILLWVLWVPVRVCGCG